VIKRSHYIQPDTVLASRPGWWSSCTVTRRLPISQTNFTTAPAGWPRRRPSTGPAITGSWARLLRRILEVDPLLCPRCGVEMKIVAVITEPKVVDAILRSLARGMCRDPFVERAPPAPAVGGTATIH